jgi:hypothetical protein
MQRNQIPSIPSAKGDDDLAPLLIVFESRLDTSACVSFKSGNIPWIASISG